MMNGFTGTVINIKGDPHICKVLFDQRMVFIDDGPGCGAFLHGLKGDGSPVFITAAYKRYIPLLRSQISDIYIRRQVGPSQVTDMFQAVGIRQCCRDQVSFWLIHTYSRQWKEKQRISKAV